MRAFWSVKDVGGGGVQKWPLRNSGLWRLQFSSQLNKQYPKYKPTSSAKIWDLNEVIESHSLASGGFRSDRGQNEKSPKITNFCLTEM
jgi:hypothetical protein